MSEKIEKLLGRLTLSEKISLCHGAAKFSTADVERLGIPPLTMSDGPHGVRFEVAEDSWDPVDTDEDQVTYLPTGTALAATWSRECARRFGEVLGAEARFRGKDIILGPGLNVIRSPICGRNFEYYSEDPHHIAEMVAPVVNGIQSQDTAACAKHYVLNSQELNRHGVDARIDERTLREIYLPGFEAAVKEGGVLSVMGAYNLFRGQHCCHNDYLLNHILKDEWAFEGLVVSDWSGTHDTHEAARHGLDVEMGTRGAPEANYLATPLERAIENGEVEEALLDDKVRRILHVMDQIGLLYGKRKTGTRNTEGHQQTAREIAEEAVVLLKNENNTLPFDRSETKNVLVVGENAVRKHHGGGNSSAVKALYEVTPFEGIENVVDDDACVEFIQGYPENRTGEAISTELLDIADTGAGVRGWTARFYNNTKFRGEPVEVRTVAEPELDWTNELPEGLDPNNFSCCFEAVLIAPDDDNWVFHLEGCPHVALDVDNEPLILQFDPQGPAVAAKELALTKGQRYQLKVNVTPNPQASPATVRLGVSRVQESESSGEMAPLLEDKARNADAVVFVGGLNHLYDLEGCDRHDMKLHEGQNDLIPRLAAANPRTAVVLVAGSPVEMPWIDDVSCVVQMWYAGMEAGNAMARILFGDVNPSGKLPFTAPKALVDSPAHYLGDYHADFCNYREGVFVGYRWYDAREIEPLFPFGHGLSYTGFEYSNLEVESDNGADDVVAHVRLNVENTGDVAGSEVVQLYVGDTACTVPRPVRELKGFDKVKLAPGEKKQVVFELTRRDLSFFDPVSRRWTCEAGTFRVEVGASSRDIRLSEALSVQSV